MPAPHGESKVKRQKLMELTVDSLEERIFQNIRIPSSDESNEIARALGTRTGPAGREFQDGLSFISVKSIRSVYPDTAESGDAYDAEAFLDR